MKSQLAHQVIASEQGFERLVGVCLLDKTGEGEKRTADTKQHIGR